MPESIQQMKQLITSKLQNFDWETNPENQKDFFEIRRLIFTYWETFLDAKYNQQTHIFTRQ